MTLDHRVPGPIASFRADPGYVPVWVLDFTGFAVKTICRVEFESLSPALIVNLQFIDITGAKPCAWTLIGLKTGIHAQIEVVNNQMAGLIFPVLCFGQIDTSEFIYK
jgi:hypothetical protein